MAGLVFADGNGIDGRATRRGTRGAIRLLERADDQVREIVLLQALEVLGGYARVALGAIGRTHEFISERPAPGA